MCSMFKIFSMYMAKYIKYVCRLAVRYVIYIYDISRLRVNWIYLRGLVAVCNLPEPLAVYNTCQFTRSQTTEECIILTFYIQV
jgi:hypothetical protein